MRGVLIDLGTDCALEGGQSLGELGLDLRDLKLDLNSLAQTRKDRGVVDITLGVVAPGQLEGFLVRGRMLFRSRSRTFC